MVKYDENFKRQIVERYLTGKVGFKALAKEFGLHRALIQRWVDRYTHHGTAGLKKKSSQYAAQFKMAVLQRLRHCSICAAAEVAYLKKWNALVQAKKAAAQKKRV